MRLRLRAAPRHIGIRTPPAIAGQRIGIMGGSFNPPHAGHLTVAETALRRLKLDRLWWLVTPGNPLKGASELAPLDQRLAACRRLARDPRMIVTAFEADLGSSYTEATLGYLAARFPGVTFVWVMGGDNLASFHRWRGWRRIAAAVPIAIVDRPGWRLRALASPAGQGLRRAQMREATAQTIACGQPPAWTYLSTRLSDLSSTALRQGGMPMPVGPPGSSDTAAAGRAGKGAETFLRQY